MSLAQYRGAWRYVMYWKVGVSEECHWAVAMKPSLCTHIASCQHWPEKFSKLAIIINKFSLRPTRLARDHVQQRAQRSNLETGPTTAWIAAIPAMVLKLCLETDSNILKIAACRETNIRYLEDPHAQQPGGFKEAFPWLSVQSFTTANCKLEATICSLSCWFVKSNLHSSHPAFALRRICWCLSLSLSGRRVQLQLLRTRGCWKIPWC